MAAFRQEQGARAMKSSRRGFLKGATAGAVGAAAAGVLEARLSSAEATGGKSEFPGWLGDPPVIPDSQIVKTVSVDIVVVGGGNAGSMCAMAAAEKGGVTVAVLESQSQKSISYYGLHDIGHLNSQYCLSRGIPKIKVGEFVAEWQRRTNNRSDPRLIKTFAENSGEMVDWLMTNAPKDVLDSTTIITGVDEKARTASKRYFELGGEINKYRCYHGSINTNFNKAAPTYIAKAEKQGATWYWEHKAVVLVTESSQVTEKKESWDENGKLVMKETPVQQTRVKGVIAKNAKGEYIKFLAKKAVVLSGGGYGGNSQMYQALQDEQRETWESRGLDTSKMHCSGFGRDGSAIKMGMWAGGSIDPGSHCLVDPQVMFSASEWKLPSSICSWGGPAGGSAPQIWVDSKGKRFHDEGFMGVYGSVFRTDRMKSQRFFGFFDYGHYEEIKSRSAPEHFSGSMASLETLKSWLNRGALGASSQGGPGGGPPGGGASGGGTPGGGGPGGGAPAGGSVAATVPIAAGSGPSDFSGPGAPGGGQAQKKQPVNAWGAKTLDELFTYMGFDDRIKATVKAEIERYNKYCEEGEDGDFGKDPKLLLPINQGPFFGVFCMPEHPMTGTVTLNGLVVDEDQAVLDKNYNPIANLYAVGNSSGGKFSSYYSSPLQGLTLGIAMTLGRVLGKKLAEA
jgi:hypothetical protein